MQWWWTRLLLKNWVVAKALALGFLAITTRWMSFVTLLFQVFVSDRFSARCCVFAIKMRKCLGRKDRQTLACGREQHSPEKKKGRSSYTRPTPTETTTFFEKSISCIEKVIYD